MARRDGRYLRPAVDAGLRAQIGDEHGRRTGQRGCALPSALRLSGSAAVGAGGGAVRHPALFWHRLAVAGRDGRAAVRCRRGDDACGGGAVPAAGHQRSAVAANDPHRNDRPLSVDPQSHVSRHGAYLCRPCDRLRRADRLRLAPVGADRDPDAGDRPRGALSRSEVRRRLPPLQNRGSPLALTIPPLPPAGHAYVSPTAIHAVVDTNGLPVRLALTAGEAHDNRLAGRLLSRLKSGTMLLADRGYDADWIRDLVRQRGAWANIPPKRNRTEALCFSPYLYRARNLIERFFNKIKQCRRVATRYDKLAANYLRSSSLRRYGCGYALMSPRPRADTEGRARDEAFVQGLRQ